MKKATLNLAAEPVEAVRRAQRFVTTAGLALLAATVLHAGLLWWLGAEAPTDSQAQAPAIPAETLEGWRNEVVRFEAVADVQRARAAANAVQLGNELIGWRTIPWSAIFADLERALPDRARLEALQPGLDADAIVRISMVAAAQTDGPLNDLLIALESHPRFTEVYPQREDRGADGLVRLQLWARYLPAVSPPDADEGPDAGGEQ